MIHLDHNASTPLAPKGVGALYLRRGVTLEPLLHGAGHEGGRRAGTESALLARLDGIAASAGSACHAGETAPSPVLRAMGVPEALALGGVRFSLSRTTTAEEIDTVIARVSELLAED